MQKIELQLIALNASETSPGNYVVVLEAKSEEKIPIIVGAFEAQAIATYMENMSLPKPLTHDVFATVIKSLDASLKEVIIHNVINGIFHSWLSMYKADKSEIKIDIRTSDALALAIRFNCPIYAYDFVVSETAISNSIKPTSLIRGSVADYSKIELEALLADLLAKEDFESASRVRDMLKKR